MTSHQPVSPLTHPSPSRLRGVREGSLCEAAGKVFAKTGTLLGIDTFNGLRFRLATKALGGVMETESGRTVLFAIMVNQGIYDDQDGVLEANNDVGAVAAAIQQSF